MNRDPADQERPLPSEPVSPQAEPEPAGEGPLGLPPDDHQRFLIAIEAGQRELRLAAELPNSPNAATGIHRHLAAASEWLAEAKRLIEQT